MDTLITTRDLNVVAPHSPRVRVCGFVILSRAIDKCRASRAGTLGQYRYDSPLDNLLFSFKGINADQFRNIVHASATYEQVGAWLQSKGRRQTQDQIVAWSDEVEKAGLMTDPWRRAEFIENCTRLGLNPETTTTFDWLEADDRASFSSETV